jgi:hypothetical protein
LQAATSDDEIRDRVGGDVFRIAELGCLGCLRPDALAAIIKAGQSHDLGEIKTLGEEWVRRGSKPPLQ